MKPNLIRLFVVTRAKTFNSIKTPCGVKKGTKILGNDETDIHLIKFKKIAINIKQYFI